MELNNYTTVWLVLLCYMHVQMLYSLAASSYKATYGFGFHNFCTQDDLSFWCKQPWIALQSIAISFAINSFLVKVLFSYISGIRQL